MNRKLWIIALSIWFVLWGLVQVTNFRFEFENAVLGFLAICVGILAILDR